MSMKILMVLPALAALTACGGGGATATSGVFHTSGSSPAHTGVFVGSR